MGAVRVSEVGLGCPPWCGQWPAIHGCWCTASHPPSLCLSTLGPTLAPAGGCCDGQWRVWVLSRGTALSTPRKKTGVPASDDCSPPRAPCPHRLPLGPCTCASWRLPPWRLLGTGLATCHDGKWAGKVSLGQQLTANVSGRFTELQSIGVVGCGQLPQGWDGTGAHPGGFSDRQVPGCPAGSSGMGWALHDRQPCARGDSAGLKEAACLWKAPGCPAGRVASRAWLGPWSSCLWLTVTCSPSFSVAHGPSCVVVAPA